MRPGDGHDVLAVATLAIVTDLNIPGTAPEDLPDRAGRTTAGTGRVRFSLARWGL